MFVISAYKLGDEGDWKDAETYAFGPYLHEVVAKDDLKRLSEESWDATILQVRRMPVKP